ncbi:DUF4880 domain-containing protein [Pseudomonas kuykendallii]|uniref:FecR family protein n=1 Tax=Pseudomonas kuykendallii TaxID=1007099 RepID=A0A1H2RLA1_9PSED|nr:FecR domain-containing protein [Pseudomonas kuykendallii]MCQ4273082.1 DUF4880 domain-containing protein [Pseudomonas kuykendallii]SDW20226.1 FecR family protein [Pseudomonas kuykendallii]
MSGPVSPQVVHEAACWFVQLQSTDASPADHDACQRWRASHAEHEAAWQQALQVSQRFGSLPSALGMQTLARSRRQSRRGVLKSVLVLGAALPAGWMMAREQAWFADYRTAVGERRRLQLQDGTRIELNSGSAISVRFDADCRRVTLLRGEMQVDAARDCTAGVCRSLVVESCGGEVIAEQATFVIRQMAPGSRVSVLSGALQLVPQDAPGDGAWLRAGQQALLTRAGVGPLGQASAHAADWTRGVLRAADMRLGEFVAELARYRTGWLLCDPRVAELRLSGTFQLDNSGPVLDSLAAALPVRVQYRTRYWVSVVPV